MIDTSIPLEEINAMSKGTMVEYLDIQITELGRDYIIGTMPVDHRTVQVMGKLHGGATMTLIESLGSIGSTLLINMNTEAIVGIEINGNHLKMADSGRVTCTAKLVHGGKKTHIWQADVYNGNGDLVCTGRLTTMVIKKRI